MRRALITGITGQDGSYLMTPRPAHAASRSLQRFIAQPKSTYCSAIPRSPKSSWLGFPQRSSKSSLAWWLWRTSICRAKKLAASAPTVAC